MKLSLVHDALTYYYKNAYPPVSADYTSDDVLVAIEECARQDEVRTDRASLYDDVYLITSWSLVNLLNMATYDICGRLIKDNPHYGLDRLIDIYVYTMQCSHDIDLTRAALASGFDFIRDTWSIDEDMECHNPDGSMETNADKHVKELEQTVNEYSDRNISLKQHTKMLVNTLEKALKYLEDYYAVDGEFLSFEESIDLSIHINNIKALIKEGESNE